MTVDLTIRINYESHEGAKPTEVCQTICDQFEGSVVSVNNENIVMFLTYIMSLKIVE